MLSSTKKWETCTFIHSGWDSDRFSSHWSNEVPRAAERLLPSSINGTVVVCVMLQAGEGGVIPAPAHTAAPCWDGNLPFYLTDVLCHNHWSCSEADQTQGNNTTIFIPSTLQKWNLGKPNSKFALPSLPCWVLDKPRHAGWVLPMSDRGELLGAISKSLNLLI